MSLVMMRTFRSSSLPRGRLGIARTVVRRINDVACKMCCLAGDGRVSSRSRHPPRHHQQMGARLLHTCQRTMTTQSPPPKADDDDDQQHTPQGVGKDNGQDNNSHDDGNTPKSLKDMLKLYGPVYMVYGGVVWISSGIAIYGVLATTGVDVLPAIVAVDDALGWDLASRVDPSLGLVAVSVALNELLEVVRFPFCVATTPAVARRWQAFRSPHNKSE